MPEAQHIHILMAACNGGRWIDEQLASIANQSHRAWSLRVSVDPSSDDTRHRAEDFMRRARQAVTLVDGPGQGHAANFLHLIRWSTVTAPRGAYVAFADQDDVWYADKLAEAVRHLSAVDPDRPALYCSRTLIVDEALRGGRPSHRFERPANFRNALLQNVSPGNTIVLNPAAHALALSASRRIDRIPAHDWWLYQLVTGAGGLVVRDESPRLFYRQHANNQVGASRSLKARLQRMRRALRGEWREMIDLNIAAHRAVADVLTPANRALIEEFDRMRQRPALARLVGFRALGLYRQGAAGTFAAQVFALLGRI